MPVPMMTNDIFVRSKAAPRNKRAMIDSIYYLNDSIYCPDDRTPRSGRSRRYLCWGRGLSTRLCLNLAGHWVLIRMARGRFISLEGGEGVGKSTQLAALAEALVGRGLGCA